MEWKPIPISFTDEELIAALKVSGREGLTGNMKVFFDHLQRPEQNRLEKLAKTE